MPEGQTAVWNCRAVEDTRQGVQKLGRVVVQKIRGYSWVGPGSRYQGSASEQTRR